MFGLPGGMKTCLFDMDGVVTQTELAKHGADIVVKDLAELLGKDAR